MASMAWGGFSNGSIPVSHMVEFEGTGKYLQADAAASLTRLFAATERATGHRPYIAAGQDLNRDLTEQIKLLGQNYTAVTVGKYAFIWNGKKWRKTGPVTCAEPGLSNHGWARAADISFPTAACRTYFRAHCAEYGWENTGDNFGEDWHKEYHGPITTTAGGGSTSIPVSKPATRKKNPFMEHWYCTDNNGALWTLVDTANRVFDQTRDQGRATLWAILYGNAVNINSAGNLAMAIPGYTHQVWPFPAKSA